MLRTLAKGLILWDQILPTSDWIQSHVPAMMKPHCLVRPAENAATNGIDYETINQVMHNVEVKQD
jgi:anaphase-promoting complex subunit 1